MRDLRVCFFFFGRFDRFSRTSEEYSDSEVVLLDEIDVGVGYSLIISSGGVVYLGF